MGKLKFLTMFLELSMRTYRAIHAESFEKITSSAELVLHSWGKHFSKI